MVRAKVRVMVRVTLRILVTVAAYARFEVKVEV